MKHKVSCRKLGMESDHRMAVIRNLTISLIKTGKIETTVAKAKALRPFVEKIITKAKNYNKNKHLLCSKLGSSIIHKELKEIGEKFADRKGGYTRITKTGNRKGDFSKIATIELVI